MKTRMAALGVIALLGTAPAMAGETMDAAIGGGLGGAAGAALGNEVGGRDGAIIGGALGAGVGAAIATDGHDHDGYERPRRVYYDDHHRGHFCPPGQAKKGNC
jgi:hypothetical protein